MSSREFIWKVNKWRSILILFRRIPTGVLFMLKTCSLKPLKRKAEKYHFPEFFMRWRNAACNDGNDAAFGEMTDLYVPSEKDVALVCQLDLAVL